MADPMHICDPYLLICFSGQCDVLSVCIFDIASTVCKTADISGPAKYGYFVVQIKVTIRRRIFRTAFLCTVWLLPAFTWICLVEGTFLLPGLPDEQPLLRILCDRLDPADSDRIVVVRLTKT